MAYFSVKEVVDGDTFRVVGGWKWDGKHGEYVRPLGYNTPEQGRPGYQEAKNKLKSLIEGKQVSIPKAVSIDDYGRLLSDAYFAGKNLADYFLEYKV